MKKEKLTSKIKRNRNAILKFGAALAVFACIMVCVYYFLFRNYSTMILESQNDQLMNITKSVSNSMEVYLQEYQTLSESLVVMDQFKEAEEACLKGDYTKMDTFLEQAISTRGEGLVHMDFYVGNVGYVSSSGDDKTHPVFRILGEDDTFQKITINKDEDGSFSFGVGAKSENGNWLTLYVDSEVMYAKTSEYLHMGEYGYVMIKDSTGIILMHQVEQQIGINVLTDRKREHPDFDFSELEVLISHQLAAQTRVETYNSYWWGLDEPIKTKKVSAYMPLYLGSDFLVVSTVIDYQEVAGEIQAKAAQIVGIMLLLLLLGLLLLLMLWNSIRQQTITANENADLRQKNEDLEKRRKEDELAAHQQRLELIGTMTSGIAHEFNNLLTPIMGYSNLILAGMDENDENYEDMKEIAATAEKAKEIIGQINQFSSRNAEQMMQPIHAAEALRRALVITEAAKRRYTTLITHVEDDNDVIIGNPVQIQQMVINLCNNALQAMGGEPGTLTVTGRAIRPEKEDKKDPWFHGREKDWFYEIEVQDTGIGMDEATVSQIFVPFFTTKRPGEGTGLGLAVVHRMVETHQGMICVHSTVGVGTVFRIYLPVAEPEEKDADPTYRMSGTDTGAENTAERPE